MRAFHGGCHCGAVRFRVEVAEPLRAVVCNCSICDKKGFVHLIVGREAFHLETPWEALSEYRFHTGAARHLFCRTCGIHSFYVPRSHPDGFDVNVRCLDGDALRDFALEPFDGRRWEENVDALRGSPRAPRIG
jgi:hypothetical protein